MSIKLKQRLVIPKSQMVINKLLSDTQNCQIDFSRQQCSLQIKNDTLTIHFYQPNLYDISWTAQFIGVQSLKHVSVSHQNSQKVRILFYSNRQLHFFEVDMHSNSIKNNFRKQALYSQKIIPLHINKSDTVLFISQDYFQQSKSGVFYIETVEKRSYILRGNALKQQLIELNIKNKLLKLFDFISGYYDYYWSQQININNLKGKKIINKNIQKKDITDEDNIKLITVNDFVIDIKMINIIVRLQKRQGEIKLSSEVNIEDEVRDYINNVKLQNKMKQVDIKRQMGKRMKQDSFVREVERIFNKTLKQARSQNDMNTINNININTIREELMIEEIKNNIRQEICQTSYSINNSLLYTLNEQNQQYILFYVLQQENNREAMVDQNDNTQNNYNNQIQQNQQANPYILVGIEFRIQKENKIKITNKYHQFIYTQLQNPIQLSIINSHFITNDKSQSLMLFYNNRLDILTIPHLRVILSYQLPQFKNRVVLSRCIEYQKRKNNDKQKHKNKQISVQLSLLTQFKVYDIQFHQNKRFKHKHSLNGQMIPEQDKMDQQQTNKKQQQIKIGSQSLSGLIGQIIDMKFNRCVKKIAQQIHNHQQILYQQINNNKLTQLIKYLNRQILHVQSIITEHQFKQISSHKTKEELTELLKIWTSLSFYLNIVQFINSYSSQLSLQGLIRNIKRRMKFKDLTHINNTNHYHQLNQLFKIFLNQGLYIEFLNMFMKFIYHYKGKQFFKLQSFRSIQSQILSNNFSHLINIFISNHLVKVQNNKQGLTNNFLQLNSKTIQLIRLCSGIIRISRDNYRQLLKYQQNVQKLKSIAVQEYNFDLLTLLFFQFNQISQQQLSAYFNTLNSQSDLVYQQYVRQLFKQFIQRRKHHIDNKSANLLSLIHIFSDHLLLLQQIFKQHHTNLYILIGLKNGERSVLKEKIRNTSSQIKSHQNKQKILITVQQQRQLNPDNQMRQQ